MTELEQLTDAIIAEEAMVAMHKAALAIARTRLSQLRAMRVEISGGAGWMNTATRMRLADLRRDRGED